MKSLDSRGLDVDDYDWRNPTIQSKSFKANDANSRGCEIPTNVNKEGRDRVNVDDADIDRNEASALIKRTIVYDMKVVEIKLAT